MVYNPGFAPQIRIGHWLIEETIPEPQIVAGSPLLNLCRSVLFQLSAAGGQCYQNILVLLVGDRVNLPDLQVCI